MKVFVTGATGSLGMPVCLFLKEKGYAVVALGRQKRRLAYLQKFGIEILEGDLNSDHYLSKFQECEALIHSAALTRAWGPRELFVPVNITGTDKVFSKALECGFKKALHISTTAVYYDGTSKTNLTESSPIPKYQKVSYASTKLESESVANKYFQSGLSGVILRPRAILSQFDQTLIPRLLPRMQKGFFPLIEEGQAIVDLTPAESICLAIEKALNADSSKDGQIYNLTNGEPISIQDLLFKVSQVFNLKVRWIPLSMKTADRLAFTIEKLWPENAKNEPPLSKYAVDLISKSQSFNIEKIQNELGFQPQMSVMESLNQMKNWKSI